MMMKYTVPARNICRLCQKSSYVISSKDVSTWSPLGAAFNTLPGKKLSLGFGKVNGLFGNEELNHVDGFSKEKDKALVNSAELLKETCSPDRTRKMVDVFDELSDTLCQVADLAEFIRVAHPKRDYRMAAENASFTISNEVEKLNTNKELYDCLKSVVQNGDKMPTTDVDNHVAKLFLFDFEQSGIHLPEAERKRVVELNEKIITLSQTYYLTASLASAVPENLVPSRLSHFFRIDNKKVFIGGFYSDTPNEEVREIAYKLFLYPNPEQEQVLQEILKLRNELGTICGFPTYAHRAVNGTTAETPDFINTFLDKLNDDLRPKAERDLQLLCDLKKVEFPSAKEFYPWDVAYYSNKYRKDNLSLSTNEIKSYFCLGACMEGLNNLTQQLFGISLLNEEITGKEAWTENVYKLAVVHETEGLLGHIYCDFYHRAGKPLQDCHFTIRGGRQLANGDYQNPIVVLMLNMSAPKWLSPCLLTPSQLDNLAHEMGHALHSMMARTKHQHVTGTRCCTDFAEVPSVLMEYFISDPRVLKSFAKHFQTKEPMSDELIHKICNNKSTLAAFETQNQVLYSALDQKLHGKHPLEASSSEIFYDLQKKYSLLKPIENIAWPLRFTHLIGYGAKYYSYLLSRSVASCVWRTYFKDDPFSRTQGEKYRRDCLSHGGGKPPRKLLNDFLNQEVSPEKMAQSLIEDIK